MPAKNIYHDAVVAALIADGWTITHDPLRLTMGVRRLYVDLGADKATLAAERDGEKIAIEVQSFLGNSEIDDLEHAVGQFVLYRLLLDRIEPERVLYMAVTEDVAKGILSEEVGKLVVAGLKMRLLAFDPEKKRITQWIN
ncbi:MAG: element excision factor XisH family protein [Gemmataceae bacterium]